VKLLEISIIPHPEEYMGMYGHTVLNACYRSYKGQTPEPVEGEA